MATNNIALTASMRSNLLSLKNTQKLFDKTQDRLSSGYKVNSAMDNPSSYFTAQSLNSRANDLSGLLDSIGQAISTLQTADQGITTLQAFVEQAKSIANNARDTANVPSKATTDNVKFDPDNARTDLLSDYVNVTAGPSYKVVSGTATVNADDELSTYVSAGYSVDIKFGDDTHTYNFTAVGSGTGVEIDTTVQEFLDLVKADIGDGKVKAEIVDGNMTFTALDGSDIKVSSTPQGENHRARVVDFSGATDISAVTGGSIFLGDNPGPSTILTLNGAEMTAIGAMPVGNDTQKAAVAAAYATAVENAITAAIGLGTLQDGDVTVVRDGMKVSILDNRIGATASLTVNWTGAATGVSDANAAEQSFIEYPNTSFNERFVDIPGTSVSERFGLSTSETGVADPGKTFTIRTGDATKMVGTANVRGDQTLSEMGMVDGQSVDIMVGDKIHTYTIGDGTGQISKDSTVQEFLDDIVYDIGRTKIKAEIVDGALTISTLDNSSIDIRSTQQTEVHATKAYTIAGNAALTQVAITRSAGDTPITVDVSSAEQTAKGIAAAINADSAVARAGIEAGVNAVGDLVIYDTKAGGATAMNAVGWTGTGATAQADGAKTVALDGTSFNELVGFEESMTVEVTDDMTVEQFRQAINNLDGISADFDTKGHLVISGEQGDDLVMVDTAGSNVLKNLYGNDVVSATNGSNERAKYAKQFDDILTQVDQLVQDTSYKGINLLNGDDLTVVFNESRTSTLALKGVTFDSTGLGFTRSSNEWISNEDIDKALNQITKATSMLRAQASEFGQNLSTVTIREDFTESMINGLQTGADKLTLADMNEESANLLALQTRQQLATNSLSLANQAAQSVLRLFS